MNNYYKMSPFEIEEDKKKRELIVNKLSDSLLSEPNYDFKPTAETRAHDAYVAKTLPMPQKQEKQLPAFNFDEYESRNAYQPTYNYKLPMPYKSNDTSDTSYNIAKSAIDNKDKDFWQAVRDKEIEIGEKFKSSSLGKAWDSAANSGIGKFISRVGDTGANMVTGGGANIQPIDTGSKVGNFLADVVGGGSGMFLNPGQNISYNQALRPIGSLAEKGTSKLTQNAPNVVKNLLPTMAREGVEQGIQEGMNANLNGADTKETLQAGLKGLGQGALFSGALKGANDYLLPNIVKTNVYEDGIKNPNNKLKYKKDILPTPNLLEGNSSDEGYWNGLYEQGKNFKEQNIPFIDTDKLISPTPTPKEQIPMETRTMDNVGSRNVKAYQYLHPEVKGYIQQEANILKGELENSLSSQRSSFDSGNERINTSNKRIASQDIASLKDLGYSYQDINKAIDSIIEDHGAENTALAKKIEVLLDNRLSNGYTDFYFGQDIPSNNEYLKTKAIIENNFTKTPTSVGKEAPNIITPKKKLPVIEPLNEVKNEQLLNTLDNKKISSNFTKDDFTKIKNTQLEKYKPNVITENWNATKGQGRRNGGMVKGSMGISYGTSEKIDYDSVLNKIDIPKEDIKYLNTNTKKEMYLKSLENGYSHKQSLLISSGYELATSDLKTLDPILKRINSEINVSPLQEVATTSEPQNIKNVLKSKNVKESQFKDGGTLRKSPIVADEASQKLINEINMEYEVKPNAQSVKRATKDLQTNFDGVVERIRKVETLNSAEDTVASGLITRQLRQQAEETGDYTQLKSWLEEIQPKVTSTAQSLQALRTWQDMSPDGVLLKAQQVVGKVNRDGADVFGKNFKKVELTTDEMKYITDTMNKIQSMTDGRAKDVEFAKVKKVIADKIPSTLSEKVAGLQRISLLLNPKTMIRNVVGNVVMGGLEGVKDLPATAIDKALSYKTGQRTTLLPDLKTLGKGFVKGAKETVEDARLGIDTSPSNGQFELPDKEIFKNPALKKLDKYTKVGLQFGDRPFYQGYYGDALRQQMKIANVDKPTKEMVEKAKNVAEDRTFQNDSAMVQGFKRLQKGLNDIGAKFGVGSSKFGIGNFAIPFTKTPANILDKAVDYTPLGTISSIKQAFKIGSEGFDQKKFVDTVGRNIVGTAAIALGYDLAKDGLLTGSTNKDKDVSSLERQAGKLPYAFKVGDKYITFDFAQPAAIPLAIGADIYHQGKNRKEAENVAIEALKSGGTTLFKQSLLQGMQRLFGGYSPVEGIANVISDIPTQFVPTSFKQINQLTDPNVKDTYAPSKGGQKINEIKNRLPMLSKTLPNKVDTLGNDVKSFDGKNNIFNVMLNPSYTSTYNPSKAEKLALDIYEDTGNTTHLPRVAKDKITYKENKDTSKTINLTSQEKNDLQRYIGKETEKAFSEYAGNPTWNNKADKEKIKDLQRRLTEIYNQGEYMILKGRGINEYKR